METFFTHKNVIQRQLWGGGITRELDEIRFALAVIWMGGVRFIYRKF